MYILWNILTMYFNSPLLQRTSLLYYKDGSLSLSCYNDSRSRLKTLDLIRIMFIYMYVQQTN
jgi:hypothetical protein